MALRTIRKNGDEILRKKAKYVKEITPNILTLLDDMLETMQESNGVGLAAPQVGVLKRIVIVDFGDKLYEMINPEIIETSGEQCKSEGCLSLPGESGHVIRPSYVKIKYTNRNGEEQLAEGTEMLAVAFCHETDHLDGVLYIDKVVEVEEDGDE